jgi:hypothetical protein
MNIDTYNEKCRLLASLATEAINLEGLNDKTKEELETISKSIIANHYRITLLGSYQGGKSTIFDTACGGGRELSPTGFGIRTSAVPAEAHSIKPGEKEHAFITWKTDKEILSGFIETISPELRDLAPETFKSASDAEIIDWLEFHNDDHIKLLKQALQIAKKNLLEEEQLFQSKPFSARSELLKIGSLVLKYYDGFRMTVDASSGRRTKVTIEDATRIVRFPEDWHKSDLNVSYSWQDVRFLFVRNVAFHVCSSDLANLKAVLVDCPGLHASRWDNEIVHDCIANSDAIIWLQGDQGKELGLSEIEEARRFAEYGITSEVIFLAFNAKGISKVSAERILDSNLAKMRDYAGLEVNSSRVAIFNALLALRCKQAQAKLAGNLTQETIDALSAKAIKQVNPDKLPDGGTDPEKNAHFLIKKDIRSQASVFLDEDIEDPWAEDTLSDLLKMSRWEDVIKQATQFIVDTKGRTRLIKKGAQPILEAITSFDENLAQSEKRATQNLEEHKKAKQAAETVLNDFGDKVDGLLLPYERDIQLTLDANEGIGPGIRGELLERFTRKQAKINLRRNLENSIDSSNHERDVREAVRQAAVEWMKTVITGWHVDARAKKSASISEFQHSKMLRLEIRMQEFLQSAVGQGQGLLGVVSFHIPEPEDHVLRGYQAEPMKNFNRIELLLDKTDKLSFLRPIRDGYEMLRKMITGSSFDKNAWKARLNDYEADLITIISESVVEEVTRDFLTVYFKAIADQIKTAKKQMHEEFKCRLEMMEQDLKRTQEERNEIAKQAKLIRKNVITPFRARVEKFIKETEATLPHSETHEA